MAVTGSLLSVKWSTGEESSLIPGAGSLAIIGKARTASSQEVPAPVPPAQASKSAGKPKKTTRKSSR